MLEEPTPVVPTYRPYWVAAGFEADQVKVAVDPGSVVPGVGLVMAAGATAPNAVYV